MSIVPSPEAGQPSGRRARKARPVGTDVALAVVSLAVSVLLVYLQLPFTVPALMARVAVGLLNALVVPGYLVVASIYPRAGSMAPLLKWVLILAASCFFDVTLALGLSVVGLRLEAGHIALGAASVLIPIAAVALVRRGPRVRKGSEVGSKRADFSRMWPHLSIGLLVFSAVLISLVPGYSQSSPSIYLTVPKGGLLPGPESGRLPSMIEVHVNNPSATASIFLLREFLGGAPVSGDVRISLPPDASWTRTFPVPTAPTASRTVLFQLSKKGTKAFKRSVWMKIGKGSA